MRVSTVHARALVEAVETRGFRGSALLQAAGVDASALAEGYAWLDVRELDALMCAAVALTGDEAFGLHWGEHTSVMAFDLPSLMVAVAPTLRTGIEDMLRFQEILGDRPELSFVQLGERAQLRFAPFAVSELAMRVRAELAVAGFWRWLEAAGPRHSEHDRAYFAHPRPAHGEEYDRLFGANVRYEHGFTGIDFARELLDRPLLPRNAVLHRALGQQAEQVRSRVLADTSIRERIKQLLLRTLPAVPEMPEAASAVGMSERSLRRRLEEEGSSYSQLVEETKRDRARELLADPSRPIKQIALALGFADVSSFHRAFKRWTGSTPAEFRAQRD